MTIKRLEEVMEDLMDLQSTTGNLEADIVKAFGDYEYRGKKEVKVYKSYTGFNTLEACIDDELAPFLKLKIHRFEDEDRVAIVKVTANLHYRD